MTRVSSGKLATKKKWMYAHISCHIDAPPTHTHAQSHTSSHIHAVSHTPAQSQTCWVTHTDSDLPQDCDQQLGYWNLDMRWKRSRAAWHPRQQAGSKIPKASMFRDLSHPSCDTQSSQGLWWLKFKYLERKIDTSWVLKKKSNVNHWTMSHKQTSVI